MSERTVFYIVIMLSMQGCRQTPTERDTSAAANSAIAAAAPTATESRRDTQIRADENIVGCAVAALSIESDPSGLNVRSAPSEQSSAIGKLFSLIETDPHAPEDPPLPGDQAIGPAFSIVAIKGNWLKIADIEPVTEGWDVGARKRAIRRNFQGMGWVHRSRVAIDAAFDGAAYDRPYAAPGDWRVLERGAGRHLALTGGRQGMTASLLACQRNWIKVGYRSSGGNRVGWFKMQPNYVGRDKCAAQDRDCPNRQNLDLWG